MATVPSSGPRVFAHRGASSEYPEHTRVAYEAAIEEGADGFECDVRLTKDSVPILWHDSTMDRTAGTKGDIAALTYLQVRDHYPQVMLFTEYLELALTHKKDIAIETKHPVPTGHDIEKVIRKELDTYKTEISSSGIEVSIMSFSWTAVQYASKHIGTNTVMLVDGISGRFFENLSSAKTLGPNITAIKERPQIISGAKKRGKRLFVWTVDDPKDVEFCFLSGIDVVITNKPAQARKVLGYP